MSGERPPDSAATGELVGLARGGGLNLVGAVFEQITLFAIILLLARALGQSAVGVYTQALAILVLLELLALSGFRAGLTRFVAIHVADRDHAALRGTVRIGMVLVTASSIVLGIALALAAPWLADVAFDDPALRGPLVAVAVSLPFVSLTEAALSATQGFRTMRYFAGVRYFLVPGLRLGVTAMAVILLGGGVTGAAIALAVTSMVGAVASLLVLRRVMPRAVDAPRYEVRELFSFSSVSWMSSLAATGLIWSSTIMLGVFLPSADVGVFQIATRLVLVANVVMVAINASFAPRIAHLWRRGQTEDLHRSYVAATSWILRLSLPAFVVLLVAPGDLLRMFGVGFAAGSAATVLLLVGKITDTATGPCGIMLNHSGRVMLNMIDNVGVLVLNVGLNLYLIPEYGIVGAASALCLSLVLVNIARVWQVRSTMGMLPFGRASLNGLVAAGIACAAGLAAQVLIDGAAVVPVVIAAVVVVYGASLLALGIPADDRAVMGSLIPSRRRSSVVVATATSAEA